MLARPGTCDACSLVDYCRGSESRSLPGFRITSPRRLMSSRKLSSRYPTRRGHDVAESASSQVQRSRTGFGVVLPRFAIEARGLAQRQFAWPRLKRALI